MALQAALASSANNQRPQRLGCHLRLWVRSLRRRRPSRPESLLLLRPRGLLLRLRGGLPPCRAASGPPPVLRQLLPRTGERERPRLRGAACCGDGSDRRWPPSCSWLRRWVCVWEWGWRGEGSPSPERCEWVPAVPGLLNTWSWGRLPSRPGSSFTATPPPPAPRLAAVAAGADRPAAAAPAAGSETAAAVVAGSPLIMTTPAKGEAACWGAGPTAPAAASSSSTLTRVVVSCPAAGTP